MATRRLKFCGWGYEGEGLTEAEEREVLKRFAERLGVDGFERRPLPKEAEISLRKPRLQPPAKLAAICSDAQHDRLTHTYGKSFPDYVRTYERDFTNAPDVVAFATRVTEGAATDREKAVALFYAVRD